MRDAVRELRAVWADLALGVEITRGEDDPGAKAFRRCIGDLYQALAAVQTQGWQPIETAPKDGTWILGYWSGDSCPIHSMRPCRRVPPFVDDDGETQEWRTDVESVGCPTHWMPIPEPPKEV